MPEEPVEQSTDLPMTLQFDLNDLAEQLATELTLSNPDWDRATAWLEELRRRWPGAAPD